MDTKHHSQAGTWKSYMDRNGTVYTKKADNATWSKYRKAGTQLHLLEAYTGIPSRTYTTGQLMGGGS